MDEAHHTTGHYRTPVSAGVWYSVQPSLIPPDDTAAWVDLHQHLPDGVIVLGRFRGVAAAITWAWQHRQVDPADWRPDEAAG